MIRIANKNDLSSVLKIVQEAKAIMQQDNNNQWDEHYPLEQHFKEDIQKETLYVLEENSIIYAFIVVDQQQSEWYDELEWPIDRSGAYVIHRLAGSSAYKGAATQLFDFAVNLALDHNIHVMVTDTFALNKRAQGLFNKFGFNKVGEAEIDYPPFNKGEPFYAYYKKLEE
ncbi:GNAT family N-acetyltransferase [Staphylococcus equorum]|uniref:GNAT family N-acetyltransferase n=1 Tax=Staphylococcus equorum TaxID=246432 RepID=A0A9X4R0Q9_9STAP|nr:GNAT family N-acetyltransferase [Staphylococcus equorum]MDG0842433.1 GNAT family N-acetyltransferase [Staphylococcus equorum]MDG0858435.1 GNAT family N-acetyltransferase [Staphylococcus equorum]